MACASRPTLASPTIESELRYGSFGAEKGVIQRGERGRKGIPIMRNTHGIYCIDHAPRKEPVGVAV